VAGPGVAWAAVALFGAATGADPAATGAWAGLISAVWVARANGPPPVAGDGDALAREAAAAGVGVPGSRGAAPTLGPGVVVPRTSVGAGVAFMRSATERATAGPAVTPATAVAAATVVPRTAMPTGVLKNASKNISIDSHYKHRHQGGSAPDPDNRNVTAPSR
jgi:hypothetical protein